MFCPKCGAQSPDGTTYCPSCGINMVSASATQAQDDFRQGFQDITSQPQNDGFTQNDGFKDDFPQNDGFSQNDGFDRNDGFTQTGYQQGGYQQAAAPVYSGSVQGDGSGILPKNLALYIILTIVTCGIFGIYWFITLTNESNQLSGRTDETSGGIAFLLTLVTCGIYGWFWAAKMGEKTDVIKGEPQGNSNILFIILQIFGLGIVNYALAQDAINKAVS